MSILPDEPGFLDDPKTARLWERIRDLTEQNSALLAEAAKRIVAAQKQRDKARRELSRAKGIIRGLLLHFTADYEAEEGEFEGDRYVGPSAKSRAFQKAERFVGERK